MHEHNPMLDLFTMPFVEDSWKKRGACRDGVDPEIFYPGKGGNTQEAKRICERCPVRQECINYALEVGDPNGVWGGASGKERRQLSKSSA